MQNQKLTIIAVVVCVSSCGLKQAQPNLRSQSDDLSQSQQTVGNDKTNRDKGDVFETTKVTENGNVTENADPSNDSTLSLVGREEQGNGAFAPFSFVCGPRGHLRVPHSDPGGGGDSNGAKASKKG